MKAPSVGLPILGVDFYMKVFLSKPCSEKCACMKIGNMCQNKDKWQELWWRVAVQCLHDTNALQQKQLFQCEVSTVKKKHNLILQLRCYIKMKSWFLPSSKHWWKRYYLPSHDNWKITAASMQLPLRLLDMNRITENILVLKCFTKRAYIYIIHILIIATRKLEVNI